MTPSFRPAVDPALAAGALAAGVALLALLFLRLRSLFDPFQARVLFSLRALAASALLAGLLGPSLASVRLDRERSVVLVLADDTASTAVPDEGGASRLDAIRRAVFGEIVPAAGRRLPVRTFAFAGGSTRPIAGPGELRGDGEGSDVLAAIRAAVAAQGEDAVAAVVVATDGGDRPAPMRDLPAVPVFAIGAGSDLSGLPNRRLADVSAPATAEAKTTFEIRGRAEARPSARAVAVRLSEGGRERDRAVLDLSGGAADFAFRVSEDAPGVRVYDVGIDPVAGEVSTLDNRASVLVEVRSLRIRVLYFDAQLSTEFRPIRRALASDPGVDLVSLLAVRAERPIRQGGRPGDGLDEGLPRSGEALEPFDAIVLGPVKAEAIDADRQRALRERIDKGGGLVLLGGEGAFGRGGFAGTPLAPLFPWEISAREPPLATGRFDLAWTPEAASHPATAGLAAGPAEGTRVVLFSANRPGALRAGATALGTVRLAPGEEAAAIAAQPFGTGRVLGIATNTLGRWAASDPAAGQALERLLRQAVRWAAGKEASGGFLKLEPARRSAPAGEAIEVSAEARDRTRRLSSALSLRADISDLAGARRAEVTFLPSPSEPGRSAASVLPPAPGPWRLRATLSDAAGEIESREILLLSGAREPEGESLALQEGFLRELASAAGGAYAPAAGASSIAARLRERIRGREIRSERSLVTDVPAVFLAFLLLAAAEWALRRRYNLF